MPVTCVDSATWMVDSVWQRIIAPAATRSFACRRASHVVAPSAGSAESADDAAMAAATATAESVQRAGQAGYGLYVSDSQPFLRAKVYGPVTGQTGI
jgi:hypothetical protein